MGASFQRVRLEIKMVRAIELLAGPLSIPQIAESLGYGDRGELEKAFKSILLMTPARHRAQFFFAFAKE